MKWCSNIYIYICARTTIILGSVWAPWPARWSAGSCMKHETDENQSRCQGGRVWGSPCPLQHQEESPIWFVTTILDSSHSDRNTQPVGSETGRYGEAHEGWGRIWKDRNHRFWRCAQAYRRVGALSGGSSKLIHYVWHRLLFLLYNWTSEYYTAALKLYFCNTVVYIIHCEA